jgi:hypothetical protein
LSTVLCSEFMRAYKFLDAKFGLKSLYEKRLKISTLSDLNDPFELLPYEMSNRNRRKALRKTRDDLAQNRGPLCFSADWRDPVIWAHYSDKHKGLCLGFEIPDEVCHRVEYVARRLQLPPKPASADANALLFTKYENWKYEKEIRVWAALNESDGGLYFANFGEELRLVKVVAGARCSLSESEIIAALGALAKDVVLIRARAGFRKFEIVKDKRGFPRPRDWSLRAAGRGPVASSPGLAPFSCGLPRTYVPSTSLRGRIGAVLCRRFTAGGVGGAGLRASDTNLLPRQNPEQKAGGLAFR